MTESAVPPRRFVHHVALRWSDLDAYGHLNNSRFLTLYEEARVALICMAGQEAGADSFADGMVIRRNEVDYLRPVGYDFGQFATGAPPSVRIELWIEELRPSRVTLAYELFSGDVLAGRARSVLVPFDLRTQSPRRLTEREWEFMTPYAPPQLTTGAQA